MISHITAEILTQLEEDTEEFRARLASNHEARARDAIDLRNSVRARAKPLPRVAPRLATGDVVFASREVDDRFGARVVATFERIDDNGVIHEAEMAPPELTFTEEGELVNVAHEELAHAESSHVFHKRRANGQRMRFPSVRACGSHKRATFCKACKATHGEKPVGCNVWRACPNCARVRDKRNQARFGRARAKIIQAAAKEGKLSRWREGGRFTDKMVTLTMPRFTRAEMFEQALELDARARQTGSEKLERMAEHAHAIAARGPSDTECLIAAMFRAWPFFIRSLRRYWKSRGEDPKEIFYSRAFEWTRGHWRQRKRGDTAGNPHFHIWLFSPFIGDRGAMNGTEIVRDLWTHALRKVGVPAKAFRTRTGQAVAHLKRFADVDVQVIRELMKGGTRGAIELSRLYHQGHGGTRSNAFTYSSKWAVAEAFEHDVGRAVRRDLYRALEARRSVQGSRGLYAKDPPAACPTCKTEGTLSVFLWNGDEDRHLNGYDKERGPPCESPS